MSRWGWHSAFTCRQPSIPAVGFKSLGCTKAPPFSFADRVALEPPDSRSSTGYPITAFLWLCFHESGAPCPPLLQTCVSSSSGEALSHFITTTTYALLFRMHIKGVKESARSASYRKSMHALYESVTVASFTLQTREFIPSELAHGSRMNTSAGNKHHFSLTCATQRALTGRSSPQQRRQQREQQLFIHHWLPPPCPPADALLFWEAALPQRQASEDVDSVCRSARRLIKLHPAGPLLPQAAAKLRARWNKSSVQELFKDALNVWFHRMQTTCCNVITMLFSILCKKCIRVQQ